VDVPSVDLPEVSQPMPLEDHAMPDAWESLSVTELSELEARALCAREDIAVFWPRPEAEHRLGQEHGESPRA
jgi:hypothetical protein